MEGSTFTRELLSRNDTLLSDIEALGADLPHLGDKAGEPDLTQLLKLALANEISIAELTASWMPTVTDWELKIALARQTGDEARHFQTIAKRLGEMGVSLDTFSAPGANPLFEYLRSLESPVERIAAGMVTLESIAYRVNERFLLACEKRGDTQTASLYRRYIQPDELLHFERGRALLEKYATTPAAQEKARHASLKTLEIAKTLRSAVAIRLGTACFPGC